MKRIAMVTGILLFATSVGYAARVYVKNERVQLSATRSSSFDNIITGQLPACTNWRRGQFRRECVRAGVHEELQSGACRTGWTQVTTLYPDCRYTPASVSDIPDGYYLETE